MVGRQISHFRIIRKIGAGGMGEVYLAQDLELDRTVALKILPADVGADSERMRRFVQEAKAASALDHPNVAHIYEIGDSGGLKFIAMQYVEGEPLSAKIQDAPLEADQIIDIAIQVADALQQAHSKGIIHRDIKPGNIMINPRGQVKVLDFGLAKISQPVAESDLHSAHTQVETRPGIILGTVQYMSPEQVLGGPLDHRTDIFSLGIVLYRIATVRLPFDAESPGEIWQQIINTVPQPIPRFNNNIPPELELIIRKCLEKDPAHRYQSAADLLIDLSNLKRDSESGSRETRSAEFKSRPNTHLLSIGALAVALLIGITLAAYRLIGGTQTIHSLAVLPFVNESSQGEADYLSDGITETTINRLSQLPHLRVLARGTVFTYKRKNMDPRKIGRELRVDAIVTGSIVQRGEDLIIQSELVNVSDGTQLWGEQYRRKFSDLLSIQQEISNEISRNLKVKLSGDERKQFNKQYTRSTEAYQLYLRGLYQWNRRTGSSLRNSIDFFKQAIVADPDFALAYAGLANSYAVMSIYGVMSPQEAIPQAKEAARKALDLDESLAEAHAALGLAKLNFDFDWPGAEVEFQRAIELNSNYATAHQWYGANYLTSLKRFDEANREMQTALDLDPLSMIINADVGVTLFLGRQYDKAIKQFSKTLEMDPEFYYARVYMGQSYAKSGRLAEAIAELKHARDLDEDPVISASLGYIYGLSGNHQEARKMLEDLQQIAGRRYVSPYFSAMVYAGLGEKDLAFASLEKALQERSEWIVSVDADPFMDSLRSDSRYEKLLRRLGKRG